MRENFGNILNQKNLRYIKIDISQMYTNFIKIFNVQFSNKLKFSPTSLFQIRSAWYNLVCTVCQQCFMPEPADSDESECSANFEQVLILSKKHLEKIASATLGRLDDASDAVVASKIWDTSLYLVSKYKVFLDLRILILW